MALPLIRTTGDEHWDCQACGICCRGSIVPLSDADVQRIRDQGWHEAPDFVGKKLYVRDSLGGRLRLAHQPDASCVFLTAEGRCRIHERFGFENKPVICRTFPLQLVPQEKQTVLTLRRACPSAAADAGRPLQVHLPLVRKMVEAGELPIKPVRAPPVQATSSPPVDEAWNWANRTLEVAARIFGDERYPPVRRVVHALVFARLLERAKLRKLSTAQFQDLLEVIEPSLQEEARPFFAERKPPGTAAGLLFRLTAGEFVRLHPEYQAPTGTFARLHLARGIWGMVRGRGALPKLHPTFPDATFATLNEPLATLHPQLLRPELQRPFERYLATSAASFQFALANRGSWSIVHSIRALALTYPLGLYLLRWATAGREPTPRDVANMVSMLDRGQGFATLSGTRYRWTLDLLESLGEFERLAVWYAR
jgi:Fe-S-cluster containining protein